MRTGIIKKIQNKNELFDFTIDKETNLYNNIETKKEYNYRVPNTLKRADKNQKFLEDITKDEMNIVVQFIMILKKINSFQKKNYII